MRSGPSPFEARLRRAPQGDGVSKRNSDGATATSGILATVVPGFAALSPGYDLVAALRRL
jgi:hypothetical protein